MDTLLDPTPARKARIEIIPLIDVIFFLLATFVLFTLSLEKILSIETILPKSTGQELLGPDSALYLQASEQGTYYWKIGKDSASELVMWDALRARLEDYARSANPPRVFVRGDRTARFGEAVYALDQVRAVGIKEVSVETITSTTEK